MTDYITVEPAAGQASAFASWCLSRDPGIQTVSAGGFLLKLDLYPDVPPELLEGGYVDGFPYDRPSPQPTRPKKAAPRKRGSAGQRSTPRKRGSAAQRTTQTKEGGNDA